MRILYFSQFYKPENIAASFRATEHSRIWVRESHDVTVFTGWPNYPVGRLFDGYEMKPLVEELIDGVRVFRSASKIQPNTSFAKRIESGVSFIANGLKNLGKKSPVGSNYDVVLVTCGTVFAAWLGVHYAKKCRLRSYLQADAGDRQQGRKGSCDEITGVIFLQSCRLRRCAYRWV